MIEDYNTVFILGAGASKPYGFPTAEELKNDICSNYYNLIRSLNPEANITQLENFINLFSKSGEISIDSFLARYEEIPEFKHIIMHGKMSIFLSISNSEKKAIEKNIIFKRLRKEKDDDDWYSWLYRKMRPLRDIEKFKNNKVAFISFNYDRSLEYAFYSYLSNSFNYVNEKVIIEQLKSIPIIHAYGKLGDLFPNEPNYFPFGGEFKVFELTRLSTNIKTIHERSLVRNDEINNILQKAQRVFILGLGFAPENVEYINIRENIIHRIYNVIVSTFDNSEQKMKMLLKNAGLKDWSPRMMGGSILNVLEENL